MRRNPYLAALANATEHARDQSPPMTEHKAPVPERIGAFFDAQAIGHPANRAKVCTAIANTMTNEQLVEAINRLNADREERIAKLEALNAPQCILDNERRQRSGGGVGILKRVLGRRLGE